MVNWQGWVINLSFAFVLGPHLQPFSAPPDGRALDVNIKEDGGEGRSAVHVAAFHGAEVSSTSPLAWLAIMASL